jgi:tetratricopeptide (TPR) repeat protein
MAREVVKRKGRAKRFEDSLTDTTPQAKPSTDLESILAHLKDNSLWYAGSVAFIAVAVLAGVLFRVGTTAAEQDAASAYARAIGEEDPEMRLSALQKLPDHGSLASEITYMIGETAYEAGNHEKAQEAFEKVRTDYPSSAFVADALEGLGFIAEDAAEYERALAYYEEAANLEGTFASRRQPFNMGRVHEKLGNLEAAVEAYREQPLRFPESTIAANADAALSRLRAANPELFPEPEAAPAAETAGEGIPGLLDTEVPVTPVPTDEIPVEAPSPEADAEAEPSEAAEEGVESDESAEAEGDPTEPTPGSAP